VLVHRYLHTIVLSTTSTNLQIRRARVRQLDRHKVEPWGSFTRALPGKGRAAALWTEQKSRQQDGSVQTGKSRPSRPHEAL